MRIVFINALFRLFLIDKSYISNVIPNMLMFYKNGWIELQRNILNASLQRLKRGSSKRKDKTILE
jgi:hypothetical protein